MVDWPTKCIQKHRSFICIGSSLETLDEEPLHIKWAVTVQSLLTQKQRPRQRSLSWLGLLSGPKSSFHMKVKFVMFSMLFKGVDPQSSFQVRVPLSLMSCSIIKNPDVFFVIHASWNMLDFNLSSVDLWHLPLLTITHHPQHSWSGRAVPPGCLLKSCWWSENCVL